MLLARAKGASLFLALVLAAGGAGLCWQGARPGGSDLTATGGPTRRHEPAPPQADRVAARVNGEAILAESVYAAVYLSLPDARAMGPTDRFRRIEAAWGKTLDRVIDREVLLQAAFAALDARNPKEVEKLRQAAADAFDRRWLKAAKEGAGVKDDEEFSAFLRAQGTSLAAVRCQWERDFMAEQYLRSRICRGRDPATAPDDESASQERARVVADLKRQAVIEYAGGR
jgi:hypothetical protein